MSMDLRLRIIVGVLIGGLLVIAFASALQFRNLALALADVGPEQPELAGQLADYANTASLGLALTGVLMLVVGVGISSHASAERARSASDGRHGRERDLAGRASAASEPGR